MLSPFALDTLGLDLSTAKNLAGEIGLQRRRELAIIFTLDPERASVHLLLDVHSPVSIIKEPNLTSLLSRGNVHGCLQSLGEWRAQVLERQVRAADGIPRLQRGRKPLAVLECPVANQLGIQPSIARVVNVLVTYEYC